MPFLALTDRIIDEKGDFFFSHTALGRSGEVKRLLFIFDHHPAISSCTYTSKHRISQRTVGWAHSRPARSLGDSKFSFP